MKKLILTVGAILVAGAAAILGGCDDSANTQSGTFLYYVVDEIPPGQEDTSDQTLSDGTVETVDPAIRQLARQYDEQVASKANAAPSRVPAAVKPAAPKVEPPLASAEDIEAAEKRVAELRGTVKKAKNGAIIGIGVDPTSITLDDMTLFGRLGDLESFSCFGEKFTDEFFAQFKDLKKLKSVTVQNASITVETLKLFATFPELESLDIRRDLSLENADLAVLTEFPKLKKLGAYYNSFTNSGANKISKSTTITSVDLRGCPDISDSSAKYLARMPQLEEVFFRSQIANEGAENLVAAPNLKFVEFQDCVIDDGCTASFAKYPSLTGLRVFRCKNFTDEGVKGLASLKLERLELRDLSVTDEGVLALKDMETLKTVELSELAVTTDALNALVSASGWNGMTSLYFFSMPVTDETVAQIAANMKGLKSITVRASSGNLSEAAIDELVKIDSLTTIDLRENAGLTVDAFMKLAKLKNLRKIYVKGTSFGDSSEEVRQKREEFKKINPKCDISIAG